MAPPKSHTKQSSKTTTGTRAVDGASPKADKDDEYVLPIPSIIDETRDQDDPHGTSIHASEAEAAHHSRPSNTQTTSRPKKHNKSPQNVNVHKRNRGDNPDDNQPNKHGHFSEAELSQESDAIETLTHLGDRDNMYNHDSRTNKSPHIGKGILKVPCQMCQGPIAVKVSAHLRKHNNAHDDNSKICQKCFNEMCKKNPQKFQALRLLARAPVHHELSFPWALHLRPYSCTQQFSEKYDFKVGNRFHIIYNYTWKEYISLMITITNLSEPSVDLIAKAPADQFETMKRVLGCEVYHDAVYNEEFRTFEWKMPKISKRVVFHSRLLSAFQEHTGTIQGCNMLFSNNTSFHSAFTTTAFDTAHPVLYPFKDLIDFPVDFPNKIFMKLISCSGGIVHPKYTHVVFNRAILCSMNNDFGINVVAIDQRTNTIYMSMKYIALEESNGEASTKLLRIIFKANGSDVGLYPFLHQEERKFAFSPHMTSGSPDFKVLNHLHTLFSKLSM